MLTHSLLSILLLLPLSLLSAAQGTNARFFLQAFIGGTPFFSSNTTISAVKNAPANSVPIQTFNFTASSPFDIATGQATGRASVAPLTLSRNIDANTPLLLQAMFTNRVFTKMVLITLQNSLAGQAVQTLVYTLNNVNIGSVSHDQTLTEDLSLRFRSGQISYRDPGNGHSTSFEFDTVALV